MNHAESKVVEGLQALAADSPRQAPAHVEARLLGEFRSRSRARLRNRWLVFSGGAIAAGIVMFVSLRPAPAPTELHKAPVSQSAPAELAVAPGDDTATGEVAENFYRLPDADILPPLDSAVIVRVQLPLSSLAAMGVPVDEDRASESVQADLLLGQDGLARGVRFID